MSRFRVLIVDDDPLSRNRLRRLLALDMDCVLAGESPSGADAVAAIAELRPDMVLLDVQMPGVDVFALLSAIAPANPLVILIAAHDQHALRAFESDVFDYLLKPFSRGRFQDSLRRAKARLAIVPEKPRKAPDRIAVRNNGSLVFLKLEEIDWFGAADNYVSVHRGRETHMVRATMAELESKLDPAKFLRVHRSAIVNLDRIRELRPWFRGDYLIILRDGTELTLTKNHRGNLESRLLLGAA